MEKYYKNLEFDVSGNTGEVFCYELSYPYTNWELNWFQSFFFLFF